MCGLSDQAYISLANDAKTLREIESLLGALDSIETLAQLSLLSKQSVAPTASPHRLWFILTENWQGILFASEARSTQ
jgi:hypothetical protein